MSERVVIFRVGDNYFSIPFALVDEIVGTERVYARAEIPPAEIPQAEDVQELVSTRFGWAPIRVIDAGVTIRSRDQILILQNDGRGGAFPVDQILGIEDMPEAMPFPLPARKCTSFPFTGVRVWKERIVLELDLSQLI